MHIKHAPNNVSKRKGARWPCIMTHRCLGPIVFYDGPLHVTHDNHDVTSVHQIQLGLAAVVNECNDVLVLSSQH